MTLQIIIVLCSLLLLAYLFDISSSRTRIPSVILLLALGWVTKEVTTLLSLDMPDMQPLLPVLGTIGLILIVLEGSLDLEINRSKGKLILQAFGMAILPLLIFSFGLAYLLNLTGVAFRTALINSIPLGIISSAIAIPTARNQPQNVREFITYESSFSDIAGVLLFNFIILNDSIDQHSIVRFSADLVLTLIVTLLACYTLSLLLSRINHHVKFIPIILIVVLMYALAKMYHLPALLITLLFGLFLGNIQLMKNIKLIRILKPDNLANEVHRFTEITRESAFLIRALFFILFGFLIDSSSLVNSEAFKWSAGICFAIFVIRYLCLKAIRFKNNTALFIAPRGLITILLFLTIPKNEVLNQTGNSVIIQVVLLSSLIMMGGLMLTSIKNHEIKSE